MTYYITMLISPTGVDILVNWSSLSVNNNLLLCILQGKSETLRYIFWLLSSLVTYRVVSRDALAYTCIGRAYISAYEMTYLKVLCLSVCVSVVSYRTPSRSFGGFT